MPENHSSFPPLPFTTAMNTLNGVEEDEEEEEDHFDSLPDALILVIFSKVSHVKYLLRCSAVRKRFASLLPQTDTIFIPIRFPKSHKPISLLFQNIVKLPLRIFHRIVPARSPSSSIDYFVPPQAVSSLLKFTGVRSLRILHSPSDKGTSFPWMRYKTVIGARLEIAAFIFAVRIPKTRARLYRATLPVDAISGIVEQRLLREIKDRLVHSARSHHRLAQVLINRLPGLCELVINDENIGKLCMGKEQIVELRNKLPGVVVEESDDLSLSEVIGGNGVVGVKMKLHLPALEKYWVVVAVVKPEDEEIVMERDAAGLILNPFSTLGGGDQDEDDDHGKAINEVMDVVRGMMDVNDLHDCPIKTNRMRLVED